MTLFILLKLFSSHIYCIMKQFVIIRALKAKFSNALRQKAWFFFESATTQNSDSRRLRKLAYFQVFPLMQEKEFFDVFYPKLWDDPRRDVRLGVSQAFTSLGLRNV